MLGPFICCKRKIFINPASPPSTIWHVNKEGGDPLQPSASQGAVDDYKSNPDQWTLNPPGPNSFGGYSQTFYREAEFCGNRFNGWI